MVDRSFSIAPSLLRRYCTSLDSSFNSFRGLGAAEGIGGICNKLSKIQQAMKIVAMKGVTPIGIAKCNMKSMLKKKKKESIIKAKGGEQRAMVHYIIEGILLKICSL